jgi:hypothetical protein
VSARGGWGILVPFDSTRLDSTRFPARSLCPAVLSCPALLCSTLFRPALPYSAPFCPGPRSSCGCKTKRNGTKRNARLLFSLYPRRAALLVSCRGAERKGKERSGACMTSSVPVLVSVSCVRSVQLERRLCARWALCWVVLCCVVLCPRGKGREGHGRGEQVGGDRWNMRRREKDCPPRSRARVGKGKSRHRWTYTHTHTDWQTGMRKSETKSHAAQRQHDVSKKKSTAQHRAAPSLSAPCRYRHAQHSDAASS